MKGTTNIKALSEKPFPAGHIVVSLPDSPANLARSYLGLSTTVEYMIFCGHGY